MLFKLRNWLCVAISTVLVATAILTITTAPSSGAQVTEPVIPTPKAATQSSTRAGGVASRAIDSNTDGNFRARTVTHTDNEVRPWWQMELSGSTSIQGIEVWNRTDCCGERLSDFWVLISNKPFASNDLNKLIADPNVTATKVRKTPNPSVTVDFGGVDARYVRVQLSGKGVLSLAEVKLAERTGPPDTPRVSQSSTRAGGVAERAFDENTDGNFRNRTVSHTAEELRPWWQVDLEESASLSHIEVWNRTDCCSERLTDYWVLVSDKPFASNDLDKLLADPNVKALRSKAGTRREESFEFGSTPIRYIRVQLAGFGILSLAEVVPQPPT